jgi:hypothetical protein
MPIAVRLAMLVLAGFVFAAPVRAAQLFPLHTGQWMEQNKQDQLGAKWTVRVDVLEEVTLDVLDQGTMVGKKYFHVREQNYDPPEGDVLGDFYVRSTDTELFIFNQGVEEVAFKLGPVGTNWIYEGGTTKKEIAAVEQITIPYGGTYTAYKYKQYAVSDPTGGYDLEWVVPGLGWIAQEEDHWVSNPARIPVNAVLARVGANPLFPLKTGMTLTYNSSNTSGQTWHMTQQVLEQVTLSDKQYFHVRETNFYPNGGVDFEGYLRSTDKAVYFYDGAGGEFIAFQVGDVGTTWTPHPGETDEIVAIAEVTVPYGGPFKAYVIRRVQADQPTKYDYEYLVPGLWSVKNTGDWETPAITHVLAGVTQRGNTAALSLLLD